jgi:hypothetical protein
MGYGTWVSSWVSGFGGNLGHGPGFAILLPDVPRYAAARVLLPPDAHEFVNKTRLSKALTPKGTAHPAAALDRLRRIASMIAGQELVDRLVCADSGNPDPPSTHGKKADEAKALELKGWPYPRHLAGRHFGVVVYGDGVGAETVRRSIVDWLTDISLVQATRTAELDGYIGYMEPYATSHEALDKDFQQATRNAARAWQCREALSCRKI